LDIEIETDLFGDSLTIEVWEAPNERLKIRVASAENPQFRELAFTTDGRQSISYSAQTNEVTIGPADVIKMPEIIKRIVSARKEWIQAGDPAQSKVLARERADGLVIYKIGMPLEHGGYAQYWIDAHQWWIRRIAYEDRYLGVGTILIRDMAVYQDLPPTHFDLDIPITATTVEIRDPASLPLEPEEAQRMVSFPLHTPAYLPAGTHDPKAHLTGKNVALVYSGPVEFTLHQGPSPVPAAQGDARLVPLRGQQARLVRDERRGVLTLTWREGELHFSISGALDQQELIRIAESLKPGL
jgi:hypothetical protein